MTAAFDALPGADDSHVVLHVPHASTTVPADVRADLLLDDAGLAVELGHLTDAHTDLIASAAAERAGRRPWQFVNGLSRLVVDPERFPDAREEMLAVGMGAVYSRTSQGAPLRHDDPERDARLVAAYFEPYAAALGTLVRERFAARGRVTIVDVHSYPRDPLPYEVHADERRPACCIGVDVTHTPAWLAAAARDAFGAVGDVLENEPFHGTYVPLEFYGDEPAVTSVMVELRRDVYAGDLAPVSAALATLVDAIEAVEAPA